MCGDDQFISDGEESTKGSPVTFPGQEILRRQKRDGISRERAPTPMPCTGVGRPKSPAKILYNCIYIALTVKVKLTFLIGAYKLGRIL
jgi:hypothetical protein